MRLGSGIAAAVAMAFGALAAGSDISLTVYSSADPLGFDPRAITDQLQGPYVASPEQIIRQVPGFAVVRDTRALTLKQGPNSVAFTDVAQFIDPTTVSLVDLSVPPAAADEARVKVLEQKFQFDLVNQQKLLQKYLDKQVQIGSDSGIQLASQP
jgi:hypothetical protein